MTDIHPLRAAWYVWSGVIFFVIAFALAAGADVGASLADDTDSPDHKSGMTLHVDHQTGCHYLGRPFGSLTPRLTAEGKPMCVGAK